MCTERQSVENSDKGILPINIESLSLDVPIINWRDAKTHTFSKSLQVTKVGSREVSSKSYLESILPKSKKIKIPNKMTSKLTKL